jgi:hypothetical protein
MFICKYCDKEFSKRSHKNHELRCPKNVNRKYKNGMTGKKGKSVGNQYTKAKSLGIDKPTYDYKSWKRGGAATWTTEQRSEAAKKQGFGGYRENAGRSKKFRVKDSFGKETVLQSTYELKCSEILNELDIKWVRPKALKYNGKNYFADFYLTDFDVWLDPKNDYKAKIDSEKIKAVIEQNNIKLYVLLEHQLTKEYIGGVAEMD